MTQRTGAGGSQTTLTRAQVAGLLSPHWGAERLAVTADQPRSDGVHELSFRSLRGDTIPALFVPPRYGAVMLYCHAHGARYDIGLLELFDGRPALTAPWGPALQQMGFGILCLEMPCFGTRQSPAEAALSKARLWQGETLFGQMLDEQSAALDWLLARPDVTRVATMGISMGGTLAWWLAALRPQLAGVVSMCCLADLETLITSGAHDGHGPYMTVPGLLRHGRTGQVAGLSAPMPALHCVGLQDWSTPPKAFERLRADLTRAYRDAPSRLRLHISKDHGHEETPAMRAAVRDFLQEILSPGHPVSGSG